MRGWLLTFHLVGVVLWMGGLMVLARILALHAVEPPSARPSLVKIESRLNYLFAMPGALVALVCGLLAIRSYGLDWFRVSLWLHIKLALVLVLVFVHGSMTLSQRRIARKDPNEPISRGGFRVMHAVLAILLVAIVALAIHQPMTGGGK